MRTTGAKRFQDLKAKALAGQGDEPALAAEAPRKRSVLERRQSVVQEQISGKSRTARVLSVPPDSVKPWAGHNRDYASLSPERCSDLIESIRRSGQQFPAIVRTAGEGGGYELICGARRHWTATYLGMDLDVEVRKLSDVDAFLLQDIENRDREDISDHERALDYSHALGAYFDNSKTKLADSLKMDRGNLTRLLQLAELPEEIVAAYADRRELLVHHGTLYTKALKNPSVARRLRAEAKKLVGLGLTGLQIIGRLKRVIAEAERGPASTPRAAKRLGEVNYKLNPRTRKCELSFTLPSAGDAASLNRLKGEVIALLEQLDSGKPGTETNA